MPKHPILKVEIDERGYYRCPSCGFWLASKIYLREHFKKCSCNGKYILKFPKD